MSNSVVPAAAAAQAKQLVRNAKMIKRTANQKPAHDEQPVVDPKSEEAHAVQAQEASTVQTSLSDVTLSSDFSFASALSEAAASSASLTSEAAQDEGGSGSDDGDGAGGTLLLVGAIGLVGLGVAVLAGGGSKNHAPTAAATQSVTTAEDTAKTAISMGATDPDGDVLTYAVKTNAAHGTAVVSNGTFTYTPAANYNGADSFVVTATDPKGLVVEQTISVTVTAVNDAPVVAAATQAVTTNEDTAVSGTVAATDVDSTALTYAAAGATKGVVAFTGNAFTYTPNANANGSDSFTVTVSDGAGGTATQTVNVTITPVNDAPVVAAATQAVTTNEDTVVSGTVAATDVDGDSLTYAAAGATKGVVAFTGNAFTYTPNANANGADSFTVTIADGKGGTATQTVNVTITPVNDAPVADADNQTAVTTAEDTPADIIISYSDVDGDQLTLQLVDEANHGTFNGATGIYTPDDNFNGTDSFTVKVSDGKGGDVISTINITVTPVNDAPLTDATQAVTTKNNAALNVAVDAWDADGDTLTYVVATGDGPAHGSVTGGANGAFVYTATAGYVGNDSFTVTVNDGHGGTAEQVVNVAVTAAVETFSLDRGVPSGNPVKVGDGILDTGESADVLLTNGAFILTDDTSKNTNVLIVNFGADDKISVSNVASLNDLSFTTGTGAGGTDDLVITYQNTASGTSSIILIQDVLHGGFITNYASAAASVGHDFMTIG